jgi:hypothetical protein
MPVIPAPRKLRQETREFEASLRYKVRPCLKKKKKKEKKTKQNKTERTKKVSKKQDKTKKEHINA